MLKWLSISVASLLSPSFLFEFQNKILLTGTFWTLKPQQLLKTVCTLCLKQSWQKKNDMKTYISRLKLQSFTMGFQSRYSGSKKVSSHPAVELRFKNFCWLKDERNWSLFATQQTIHCQGDHRPAKQSGVEQSSCLWWYAECLAPYISRQYTVPAKKPSLLYTWPARGSY